MTAVEATQVDHRPRSYTEDRVMHRLEQLLGQVEHLVIHSWKVPLTTKTVVDEDKLIDLLEELRAQLPTQLKDAEELLARKEAVLDEARQQAEGIMAEAQRHAQALVEETEVFRLAAVEAQRVRAEGQALAAKQQQEADRYAEQVLAELENKIARTLTTIQNGRAQLSP